MSQSSQSRISKIEYKNYQDDWYNIDEGSKYTKNTKLKIKSRKIKPAKFKNAKLHARK